MFYCAIIVSVSSVFVALYHLHLEITRYKVRNWGIPVLKTDDVGVQLIVIQIADKNDNGPHFSKILYTGGKSFFLFKSLHSVKMCALLYTFF